MLKIHRIYTERNVQICQVHFNFEGLLLPEINFCNQMLPISLGIAVKVSSNQEQTKLKISNSHEFWELLDLKQTRSRIFSTFAVN